MQAASPGVAMAALRDRIEPGRSTLDAWLVDLDQPPAGTSAVLDKAERGQAASFVRPLDGARFAASRAALRLVLAGYLQADPEGLAFRVGPHGQPRLAEDEVRFSLSRSGGLALVAVSSRPVGADLERVEARPELPDVAAARFGPREAVCIAAGCCGSPALSFYRHWTAKEAYLKAIGLGLRGLREAELMCCGPAIRFAGMPVAGWSISVASVGSEHVATVVGRQPVTTWRWLPSGRPLATGAPAGSSR
jgi:4'-phosphopantetheinyl transferase